MAVPPDLSLVIHEEMSAPIRPPLGGARALFEVMACSGYPTQLAIGAGLAAFGMAPAVNETLSPAFVFAISGLDTIVLLTLIFGFLKLSGDRPAHVFLGCRPLVPELTFGLLTVPGLLLLTLVLQAAIGTLAPSMRNVPISPFAPLLESPALVAGFVVLVVIAGGLREELQRAFLVRRFEESLGGAWFGVFATSVAFGLGHTLQGWDAAVTTGVLGACWGALYVTRGSTAGTIVGHAGFNLAQVLVGYAVLTRS